MSEEDKGKTCADTSTFEELTEDEFASFLGGNSSDWEPTESSSLVGSIEEQYVEGAVFPKLPKELPEGHDILVKPARKKRGDPVLASPPRELDDRTRMLLRRMVRYLYGVQDARVRLGNKAAKKADGTDQKSNLHIWREKDNEYFEGLTNYLKDVERRVGKDLLLVLGDIPIWNQWLMHQRGIGPRLGGVLLSEFDLAKTRTCSSFLAFCGLSVDVVTGKAVKAVKGKRLNYSPWLKAKVVKDLCDSFIKSGSWWNKFYYNYKKRLENKKVEICAGCLGTGIFGGKGTVKCENCGGSGGPAPWGRSKKHRHLAANRYMAKMFLMAFYYEWMKWEKKKVRVTYAEEHLDRHHGQFVQRNPDETVKRGPIPFLEAWAEEVVYQPEEQAERIRRQESLLCSLEKAEMTLSEIKPLEELQREVDRL